MTNNPDLIEKQLALLGRLRELVLYSGLSWSDIDRIVSSFSQEVHEERVKTEQTKWLHEQQKERDDQEQQRKREEQSRNDLLLAVIAAGGV